MLTPIHVRQRYRFMMALSAVPMLFSPAFGHGVIGARFFPATLAVDDPFVADEMSLPTISTLKSSDDPAVRETDYSIDLSKRLSPDLGIGFEGTYRTLKSDDGSRVEGLDNFAADLMVVLAKSPAHEALTSVKLDWDMGGTGNSLIGEKFGTLTPSLLFGKGFGDLPDAASFLKPLALTGIYGVSVPTQGMANDESVNPRIAHWGFTAQYNLHYLQSNVKDIGLKEPFSRLIPIVEIPLQTPLNGDNSGHTTGTINPGLIWFGHLMQVGLEAQLPINHASGRGVGVLGQLHLYLDDIAPGLFTWTPFNGVLGPTQTK